MTEETADSPEDSSSEFRKNQNCDNIWGALFSDSFRLFSGLIQDSKRVRSPDAVEESSTKSDLNNDVSGHQPTTKQVTESVTTEGTTSIDEKGDNLWKIINSPDANVSKKLESFLVSLIIFFFFFFQLQKRIKVVITQTHC